MKYVVMDESKCTGCRKCESACSKVLFKVETGGEQSAIRIIKKDTGGYTMTVCNHCGLCIDLCPVGAITRNKQGTVLVNRDKCVGCQACVGFCQRGVMRRWSGAPEPFKCISCGACIKACPQGALSFKEVDVEAVKEVVYWKLEA